MVILLQILQEICSGHTNSSAETMSHGQSDPETVCDTLQPQDVSTHQMWGSYVKLYRRYAPDMVPLELLPEIKVTVTHKQSGILSNPRMYLHTKFGIPMSNNIEDILWRLVILEWMPEVNVTVPKN